jgi:purine-cytosine permease-like protein
MGDVRKGWSASPIGFRDARLEASDFSAAMALVVAGIPALLIGAELVGIGLDLAQMIIAVPLGAIIGGGMIGLLGRQAAASAAPGVFLLRAPLGSIGAAFFSIARLALTVSWAAVIVDVAGGWIASAVSSIGLPMPDYAGPLIVAVLAVLLFFNGLAWSFDFIRRRMFPLVIVLTLIVVWRLLTRSDPVGGEPLEGGFLEAVDAVVGLAVLWSALGSDAGGHGQREEETASGLGLGYAIATIAFVLAGAAVSRVGELDAIASLGGGIIGAVLLLFWVPVMEIDGAGGLMATSVVSLQSLLRRIPPTFGLLLAGAAAVAGAIFVDPELVRRVISIATVVVAPALAVLLVDALLVRPGGFHSDELFRWRGEYGTFNVRGIAAWVVGTGLGLWLRPDLGVLPSGPRGLPAILLGMIAAVAVFWPLSLLGQRRRSQVIGMRNF